MRRWLSGVVLAVGALAAVAAPAASADPVASVTDASWQGNRLTLDMLAKSVPLGVENATVSAQVTVAGVTVPANVSYATSEIPDTSTVQSLMLVIDASGSMTGGRQRATNKAVTEFLASAPTNAKIGVVAFSKKARLLSAPTTDRELVRNLVSGLRPSGDTAIYDAVSLAVHVLGDNKPCTLLVLTDGEDTASRAAIGQAKRALAKSACTASFIGLQTNQAAFRSLEQLAAAGRGRAFTAADAEGIAGVFVQSFTTTNASIAVFADFPAGFTERNRAISIDLVINDEHVGLTTKAPPVGEPATSVVTSATLMTLAAVLFVSVFLLVWLLSEGSDRARRRRVDSLIAEYALRRIEGAESQRDDTVVETLEDLIRPILVKTNRSAPIVVQLDGAGLNMTAELWTLIRVGLALLLAVLAGVLSGSAATAIAVGAPLGFMAPQMWLKRRRKKRGKSFEAGLPDALMLMASSLRSGFSLDQAIVATSDQADSEVSIELRRAVQEIRIGSPLEAALDRIAERMDSSDFRWVVTALRIQRKSGGNLAELLITVSHTVRERAQMSREVAALTAEGRLSSYVLIGLPLVLFSFLMLTQPTYLEPLYKTSMGLMISGVGIGMLFVGWLLMKKLVQVDV